MAEYYAVLSKAVAGLGANSADTRRAVYDKARNALIGQLKAIDPPLPTAEISRQRLELEEAIRRVERETSAAPAGAQRSPRPAAEQAPRQTPQDVFRRAIQEAEREAPDGQRLERAPAVARVADDWSSERTDRAPPARPTPQYLPSQGYVEEQPRGDEPRLAPDYDYEWDPNAKPEAENRAGAPYVDARERQPRRGRRGKNGQAAQGARGDEDHAVMERKARPSRLPTILLIVLIIAMLGGLGALGWSQRAVIADLLRPFDSNTPAAPTVATGQPVVDANAKDTDRLLPGQTAPANDVRVVAPDGAAPDTSATGTQATGTGVLPNATAANQTAGDEDALVAQRAVLYEEPLDSAAAASGVVAINAAVTWSFVQGTDGAEIVGNIDVPERKMKLKITLRRNTDQTLPASHLVEVVITAPADFPGKGIRDVPRLVLKPSEEARGQPLIGASAKVADGFFWIGLSSEAPDVANNLKLLKERTWIDLPLVYESGQRAILTFEKGTPGERVFDRALTAWAG